MFLVFAAAGTLLWLLILVLPWQAWRTRESIDAPVDFSLKTDLNDVTVLIPARNEEKHISRTLSAVMAQGANQKVIVIDDESSDDTAAIVNEHPALRNVTLLSGKPLPDGWNGKLWSLQQGFEQVDTPLVLLLDADIELGFDFLAVLRDQMNAQKADMMSVMASLRMVGFWEGLLMPAFVFFFKLLYPFNLSNSDSRYVAAAAGGCILIRADVLRQVGGFENIRNELIDDCALARAIKNAGFRTWTGLTHSAQSVREYTTLSSIWNMVARTAYTQLRYSLAWLLLCTVLMLIGFVAPVFAAFSDHDVTQTIGIAAWVLMVVCYIPTLVYYGLAPVMSVFLPVVGLMFLTMTWTSAVRHWTDSGAIWKERSYSSSGKTSIKQ